MNAHRQNRRETRSSNRKSPRLFETLESRRLLSASLSTVVHPTLELFAAASTSTSVSGYTPAQIEAAYGFNTVSFSGVSGTGAGQTIAIIDAYNDPNIASDLHVFDQQFGLADPNLTVVNQSGGSASTLATNTGWAGEISLDVEWAHAIAPQANILLVEANSAILGNLLDSVNYARSVEGVSVISMSWGSSEFFGQTAYDSDFTTPTGHQGITFVASSGDDGSAYGPEWPASSPDVLSVGGTTLTVSSTGAYESETGWSDSGGGVSSVEPEPSYQSSVQSTGAKTTPDVSYNADPNTGYAIYDSVPDQGFSGWQEVGGTSAGAPQWSALVAIADQGRALEGKGTLNGASNTLPTLYSLYSVPGSSGYASYTSEFNDITGGSSSRFVSATAGYDEVSGLGSPKAGAVVNSLLNAVTQTLTTTGGGHTGRGRFGFFSRPAISVESGAPSQFASATAIVAVANGSVAEALASFDSIAATAPAISPQFTGGVGAAVQSRLASMALGVSIAQVALADASVMSGVQIRLAALPAGGLKIALVAPSLAANGGSVSIDPAASSPNVQSTVVPIASSVVDQVEAGLTAAVSSLRFDFADQSGTVRHDLSVSTLCAGGLLIGYACLNASNSHRAKQKKCGSWPFAMTTEHGF